jgi:hypothetical protein
MEASTPKRSSGPKTDKTQPTPGAVLRNQTDVAPVSEGELPEPKRSRAGLPGETTTRGSNRRTTSKGRIAAKARPTCKERAGCVGTVAEARGGTGGCSSSSQRIRASQLTPPPEPYIALRAAWRSIELALAERDVELNTPDEELETEETRRNPYGCLIP